MFSANPKTRDIGVLIFEDFQLLDAAGPISVFEMPNPRHWSRPPYRLTLYSLDRRPHPGVLRCLPCTPRTPARRTCPWTR
jgi:transcriptional regulator GlxA family with amidase domain